MTAVEQPPSSLTRTVDGHRVGVTVEGTGEPLVLVHGIGRNREDWSAVLPFLARSFTVYAVDVEGFGESAAWGTTVSLSSMARMVRRTIDSLGETRPLQVVGNSMGGAIAMRMVADDPAAFAGIVLLSPAGFGRDASFGLRLLTAPVAGGLLLRAVSTPAWLRLQRRLERGDPSAVELALEASRRLRRAASRKAYMQVIHDLGTWSGIRQAWRDEVLQALAGSDVPVLVLWGDRDTVLPPAHLAAVPQAVPHAVARSLPGLGHLPHLEQPERIAGEIAEFLLSRRAA